MSINLWTFPSVLKLANVTPVYKTRFAVPASALLNLSKILENLFYDQIALYFEKIFSKYQTPFRKGFNR